MNALELIDILRQKNALPHSVENPSHRGMASRSEVKRWLKQGFVSIDGDKVGMQTEINFPVDNIVFFSKSPKKTTMGPFL